jgi:hypothetical protein
MHAQKLAATLDSSTAKHRKQKIFPETFTSAGASFIFI